MADGVLICPNCRARVFGSWQACKFCGTELRVGRIDASVHPDDLARVPADDRSGDGSGSAPSPVGSGSTGPRSPWGTWAGAGGPGDGPGDGPGNGPGVAGGGPAGTSAFDGAGAGTWPGGPATTDEPWTGTAAPEPSPRFGDTSWAAPATSADETSTDIGASPAPSDGWDAPSPAFDVPASDRGGFFEGPDLGGDRTGSDAGGVADQRSLVPLEGAEGTWVPGPAPTVPDDGASSGTDPAGPGPGGADATGDSWDLDEGPSGLDPVSWYPEPGSTPDHDPGDTGTIFADPDPVAWRSEPGEPGGSAEGTGHAFAPEQVHDAPWGDDRPTARSGGSGHSHDGGFDPDPDRFDPDALFRDPEPAAEADADADGDRFDPGVLFTDPEPFGGVPTDDGPSGFEPLSDPGTGQDLEPVAPGGELAVNWEPAAADAWDSPVEPTGKAKRQAVLSREARLLVAGIIVALLGLVAVVLIRDNQADHPSEWASSVQEMATWVSKTRDLPFAHPVRVVTMNGSAYDAAVKAAGVPDRPEVKEQLTDQVAMWRALGAVEGNPTARRNAVIAQDPRLGAFYDLDEKQLVVRQGVGTPSLREGLAGALSVALDDQRADLSSLNATDIAEDPLFDVVLGTAALMRADYVDRSKSTGPGGADPATDDPASAEPPDFLSARRDLAVALGEPFARIVRDVRGVEKLNELATSPPASSQQVMLPMAYFDGRGALAVPQPEAPEGARKLSEGTIGAQAWYLLVAAHTEDPGQVDRLLDFANRWAGDAFVAYRKQNGQVCVTDVLRGSDESETALLSVALDAWRDAQPDGHIEVRTEGTTLTVVGCDPGTAADPGLTDGMTTAAKAAVTRSQLAAGYYLAGTKIPNGVNGPVFAPRVAWCIADNAVDLAQPDQLAALAAHEKPLYRDLTLGAANGCDTNLADQLFVDHDD